MNLEVISLNSIIEKLENQISQSNVDIGRKKLRKRVKEIFSEIVSEQVSFGKNIDMLYYLRDKAVEMEITRRARNFFIIDSEKFEILGLFTLTLKVVSFIELDASDRKSLALSGKNSKNIEYVPGILIAQFGKNYKFDKITGDQIMGCVFQKIQEAQGILGGKMVYLDSVNEPRVINFYEKFGFKKYGNLIKDKHGEVYYQPMAIDMSDID